MNYATLAHVAPNLAEVVAHLAPLDRLTLGRAVVLSIGGASHVAVRYSQVRDTLEGSRAHANGERTYTVEAFYVLGQLPSAYVQRKARRFAFNVRDDADAAGACGGVWYVAGHTTPESQARARELGHYSGPHYLLFREEREPIEAGRIMEGTARTL